MINTKTKSSGTIYFYANLGDLDKPVYGGGEAGNRRTLEIIQKLRYDVIPIAKYLKSSGAKLTKIFKTGFKMFSNLQRYFRILFKDSSDNAIVHISGFYGVMVYWEFLLLVIAKKMGYRIVYEMRGGGADKFFKTGNKIYRKIFTLLIKSADVILSQGEENMPLLKQISKSVKVFYYPNYVLPEFIPETLPVKPNDKINLIYFGRLSPQKNIQTIITSLAILKSKISDKPVTLTLIGAYSSKDYFKTLNNQIKEQELCENVTILPPMHQLELVKNLRDKHYFIFPSEEEREGHSNALTEAMAYGIVPIASRQGFNSSVVNNHNLIMSTIDSGKIVDTIIEIESNNKFVELSLEMYERVKVVFSYDRAVQVLSETYTFLLK